MSSLYLQLAKLVLSYRWQRGWYYWHQGSKRAALGQWRRLPQALGWSSGETYFQLSQELRDTLNDVAGDTCEQWSRQRFRRSSDPKALISLKEAAPPRPQSQGLAPREDSSSEEKELVTTCQIEPDNPFAWLRLGQFYEAHQQTEEALEAYLRTVETGAEEYPSLGWSNLFYMQIPDPLRAGAIERYAKLVERCPDNPEPATNMGRLLSISGLPQEAITANREASRRCIKQHCGGNLPPTWDDTGSLPPKFLIVGVQKCGTSSLYAYMREHPQVLPGIVKEIYFFSHTDHYYYGLPWYLAHFPQLKNDNTFITGEASPTYFHYPLAAERIADTFPDIKLIILLRDPSDRFVSHYQHWVRQGYESRPLEEVLDAEIEAWQGITPNQIAANQERLDAGEEPNHEYLYQGLYAYHIQNWLQHFSREQLLILTLEEMAQSPPDILRQTCQFLGLPNFELENYPKFNSGQYKPQRDRRQQDLANLFAPHNQQLEQLLDRTFPWSSAP